MFNNSLKDAFFCTHLKEKLFLSKCCKAPVQDSADSYDNTGRIYLGYFCTKCSKHLYKPEHLIKNLTNNKTICYT